MWDTSSGACEVVLQGGGGDVYSLAVLGDGRLAAGCEDGAIRVWA